MGWHSPRCHSSPALPPTGHSQGRHGPGWHGPGPSFRCRPTGPCAAAGAHARHHLLSLPQVDDLKATLAIQEAELKQKNENADKLIHVVGVETEKVSKEKAVADEEEAKVEVINKVRGRARLPRLPAQRRGSAGPASPTGRPAPPPGAGRAGIRVGPTSTPTL